MDELFTVASFVRYFLVSPMLRRWNEDDLQISEIFAFQHLFLVLCYINFYLYRWHISGPSTFTIGYIFQYIFLWWYWILCTMFMIVIEYWKWEGGWWYPLSFFPCQSQGQGNKSTWAVLLWKRKKILKYYDSVSCPHQNTRLNCKLF